MNVAQEAPGIRRPSVWRGFNRWYGRCLENERFLGYALLAPTVLVVLGHTQCGAVAAVAKGAELHGNIPLLVDNILPAVEHVKKEQPDLNGDAFLRAVEVANVWQGIDDLMKYSPAARKRVQAGKLKVIGAHHNILTGEITWLGTHPRQKELLAYTSGPKGGGHGPGKYHWRRGPQ